MYSLLLCIQTSCFVISLPFSLFIAATATTKTKICCWQLKVVNFQQPTNANNEAKVTKTVKSKQKQKQTKKVATKQRG